jgi:hypothetical protein
LLLDLALVLSPDEKVDHKAGLSSDAIRAMLAPDTDTFRAAASCYRDLLVQLVEDPEGRKRMGRAAVSAAAARSWHGAMECMVEGYTGAAELTQRRCEASGIVSSTTDVADGSYAKKEPRYAGVGTALRLRFHRVMRERVAKGWGSRVIELGAKEKAASSLRLAPGTPLVRTSSIDSNSSVCLSTAEEGGAPLNMKSPRPSDGQLNQFLPTRRFVELINVKCKSHSLRVCACFY